VGSASKFLTNIVRIGADIETFAADDSEIDLRQANVSNFVRIHMNAPRFPLNDLPFTREFVKRHALLLNRGHHRRDLVEVAVKLRKCFLDH
jgi:hypothetical protein